MILPTDTLECTRPLSNDERRAVWAARYYAQGLHRREAEPLESEEKQETEQ